MIYELSGFFFIDSILNEYLILLGEFHMDAFEDHPNALLCYTFFLGATFLLQIVSLNMLIAIMGDTYDRVMDQRPTHSLR